MRSLVLLALLAVLLAGCGASDPLAAEEVSAAVAKTAEAGSSRMEVEGDDGDEHVVMRGVADHERRRASFTYDVTSKKERDSLTGAELRVIGSTMYMESSVFFGNEPVSELKKPKPWFKLDRADEDVTLDTLLFPFPFIEPGRLLAGFQGVSGAVESLGEETVRGVPTSRYRLTLDLARLIETAPARDRAKLRKELEQRQAKTEPVEVSIDDAGLARRLRFVVDSDPVTIDFFDFGIEVDVEAPPADQVSSFDDLFVAEEGEGSGEYEELPVQTIEEETP